MKNSIWDKMKGFATPYAADDNYDDEELDDELDDGFSDDEPSAPRFSRSNAYASEPSGSFASADPVKPEPLGDSYSAPAAPSFDDSYAATGFNARVMGGSGVSKQQMVLFQPQSFNEISGIAKNLRIKKAIVLNLEGVDHNLAMRCVDFLSGCAFAVDGTVKKVANAIYVFCPNNMEVVGDLPSMQADVDSIL